MFQAPLVSTRKFQRPSSQPLFGECANDGAELERHRWSIGIICQAFDTTRQEDVTLPDYC